MEMVAIVPGYIVESVAIMPVADLGAMYTGT